MRMTSRTLYLITCVSLMGGVSCSDDSQPGEPTTDGGHDAAAAESSTETTASSGATSSGGHSSTTTSETSGSTLETVDTEVSSSQPDASDMQMSTDTTYADASSDAGADAATSSTESAATDTLDAAISETGTDASVAPEEVEFIPPRGPCDLAGRVGRFSIEAQSDFGIVQGSVSSGVLPAAVPDLDTEIGECRLNKRRTLSCLPACVAGETCGEDGDCIPYPAPLSAGEVNILGLTKATSMIAQAPSYLYFAPGANNPPYAPGSEITLIASGSTVPAFNLFGVGSEPLTESPTWTIQEEQDLELTWPASDASGDTTVLVEVTVDQHGASPLSLSCEFPDTGHATVPASMIDRLLQAGISGFPNGRITRRTVDHVEVEQGCIELAVGSPRPAEIVVAGHTPCNGPEDCPEGQHCNLAIEQCEDD